MCGKHEIRGHRLKSKDGRSPSITVRSGETRGSPLGGERPIPRKRVQNVNKKDVAGGHLKKKRNEKRRR